MNENEIISLRCFVVVADFFLPRAG